MTIVSAKYLDSDQTAVRVTTDTKSFSVPVSTENRHYAKVAAWVLEGNTIEAYETTEEAAVRELAEAEDAIRETYAAACAEPVEVTLDEGTLTFNGGEESASSINGAITLASSLEEETVTLTDYSNEKQVLSYESATAVAVAVGKAYREAFFAKQEALVALNS